MSLAVRFGCFGGVAAVHMGSWLGYWGAPVQRRGDTAPGKHRLWAVHFIGMNIFMCLDGGRRQIASSSLSWAGDH